MPVATISEIITSTANSAGSVKDKAQRVKAAGKGLESEAALAATGDALTNIQEQLDSARRSLQGLAVNAQAGGLTLAILIAAGFRPHFTKQQILTAPAQLLSYASPTNAGDTLDYWIRQDGSGSGGTTLNWDTNFKFTLVDGNDATANSVSLFDFCAFVDPDDSNILKWFCTGWILGQII